ncbi:MAG: MEKHLA domain-containing protein [Leptolyngbyaceae cyanobacterium bins.59]|nr:MEKHLA domain-containing protein [Leptolyngbyaceae cyanobacterium bins.59]
MRDPIWQDLAIVRHTQFLLHSYHHWTGQWLLTEGTPTAQAQQLFEAPFVMVSHGTEADPIFNYGNQTALDLWEMTWDRFTSLPSRHSVAPDERADREKLLAEARSQGYVTSYTGVRISTTGRRFYIKDVILYDVLDEHQERIGQAATFPTWEFL